MDAQTTISAWKNRRFRKSLQNAAPKSPAGDVETIVGASADGPSFAATKPGYYTWIYACCNTLDCA